MEVCFTHLATSRHTESVLALPLKNTDKLKLLGLNAMYIHIRVTNIYFLINLFIFGCVGSLLLHTGFL